MIPKIPIKNSPQMADKQAGKVQSYIAARLPWIDHAFGICERLITQKNGQRFVSANAFISDRYVQVMPCAELGNFCFFVTREPHTIGRKDPDLIFVPFSLIFWFNVDECSSSADERNIEAVKAQIVSVLGDAYHLGMIYSIDKIYDRVESVFQDFTYDVTGNQYMMHPYAGIRVDGELRIEAPCYETPANRGSFDESFDESFDIKK